MIGYKSNDTCNNNRLLKSVTSRCKGPIREFKPFYTLRHFNTLFHNIWKACLRSSVRFWEFLQRTTPWKIYFLFLKTFQIADPFTLKFEEKKNLGLLPKFVYIFLCEMKSPQSLKMCSTTQAFDERSLKVSRSSAISSRRLFEYLNCTRYKDPEVLLHTNAFVQV